MSIDPGDRTPLDDRTPPSRGRTPASSRSRSRSRSQTPLPKSAKIVIEKLTKNIHPPHLHEIFSAYGPIADLEMPTNPQFLMNKGIAYILYTQPQDAEEAIAAMHEAQVDGAVISVSIVLPRRRWARGSTPPGRRPGVDRFGEPHRARQGMVGGPRGGGFGGGRDRTFGGPPGRGSPPYRPSGGGRGRSPPPRYGGPRGGGGGGYRDRYDDRDRYRPRSVSRSRSPPRRGGGGGGGGASRRGRSPSYGSRSRSPGGSRTPPRRSGGGGGGSRRGGSRSPPPSGRRGGGGRRRSPSHDSFGSRSRSRERRRR